MPLNKPVHRIAIVGTGVIGASWAALYLARGFDVIATDPAPNAEANLRKYVDDAWDILTTIGLSPGGRRERLSFTSDMHEALSRADFVQENGPERPDFKVKLYADMDAATPVDSLIASSSSSLTMSVIQAQCQHPERCVIGHPFNPPHIIPLVEVVGGSKTSPAAIEQAMSFYRSIGKKAIYLRKEIPGHVANRLQTALYKEVLYLIEQGVLSVADADAAVSWGPGLRWGHGSEPAIPPGRRCRRNPALHGTPDARGHREADSGSWDSNDHARAKADSNRRCARAGRQAIGGRTREGREPGDCRSATAARAARLKAREGTRLDPHIYAPSAQDAQRPHTHDAPDDPLIDVNPARRPN